MRRKLFSSKMRELLPGSQGVCKQVFQDSVKASEVGDVYDELKALVEAHLKRETQRVKTSLRCVGRLINFWTDGMRIQL
jgi:hypothetical protein